MHATRFRMHIVASIASLVTLCGLAALGAIEPPQDSGPGNGRSQTGIRITVTSVMVDNQDKALKFYTEILGFVKKADIPLGEARWLTVVSPEQPEGPELLLEPMAFAPARIYQKALFDAGIPAASFGVVDIAAAYERMRKLGVVFRSGPRKTGPVTVALLEDTCGNLIQLAQR